MSNSTTKKGLKETLKECSSSMQNLSENLAEAIRQNSLLNTSSEQADAELNMKISGILSGAIKPNESYEDSDQSPLKGAEAQHLRNQWARGMDYLPHVPFATHISSWLKVIYNGDYEKFLKMIENKSEPELTEMLQRRETMMNVSAIFHVIIGARTTGQPSPTPDMKKDHLKIFIKLLSLKCDINVRDVAGYTPLHYCCNGYGNEVTKKMAELLLNAGADINARNRFGNTPLQEVSLVLQYDFITFLLDKGADPYIKDNDGCSPAGSAHFNPKLMDLFRSKYSKDVKTSRVENTEASKEKCGNCEEKKKDRKKCTGCFHIWYCNRECQLQHWDKHKRDCKKIVAEYKECNFKAEWATSLGMVSGKVVISKPSSRPKKSHFVVKIQVPLTIGTSPDSNGDLGVYNKDRSFMISLRKEDNEDVYKELRDTIEMEGFKGLKGYFHAILEKRGGKEVLKINTTRICPLEPW